LTASCHALLRRGGPIPFAIALWIASAALVGTSPSAIAQAPGEILVTVGDVTATTANLWVAAPAGRRVEVAIDPGGIPAAVPTPLPRAAGEPLVHRLHALQPGTRVRYRVTAANETVHGEFVTAPPPDALAPVRLAWSGDIGSRGHCRTAAGWSILDAVARRQPDVFVFVGDTIYADHRCWGDAIPGADFVARTPEQFRAKHHYNRADPAMQRLLRATSVVAIWDDHDVRGNFSGPAEPLTPIGLAAFLAYWPLTPPPADPTRLYRALRWGRHLELFILDTRQYRTPNRVRDGSAKSMLGAAQRRWLVDAVATSTATWKVIVSSVPLSIPKGWPFGDSWARRSVLGYETGFASERDAVFRQLAAHGVDRVVALVADVHYGAFMSHRPLPGFEVHELIAGPLAASMKTPDPPSAEMNSTVHIARGGLATFGAMDVSDAGIDVRLLDSRGSTLGEVSLPARREPAR
jgi:alkaline phosphatase D